MHPISIEIYSENAAGGIFYKSGLTQPWNTVNKNNTARSMGNRVFLTFRAIVKTVTPCLRGLYFGLVTKTSLFKLPIQAQCEGHKPNQNKYYLGDVEIR